MKTFIIQISCGLDEHYMLVRKANTRKELLNNLASEITEKKIDYIERADSLKIYESKRAI